MRIGFFWLLLAVAAPAAAQSSAALPSATLEALRRDFPQEYAALASDLADKTPEEGRRLAYAGIERFLDGHRAQILAAPGATLVAIEARHGAMLRSLGRESLGLCAVVGDQGFFSVDALAGSAPAGLDAYGAAMVEAASAGTRPVSPDQEATREDFVAWLAVVASIEPDVPVENMLADSELRRAASADHLCRGAAAMHEAVLGLPREQGERLARTLVGSLIGP